MLGEGIVGDSLRSGATGAAAGASAAFAQANTVAWFASSVTCYLNGTCLLC